MSFAVLEKSSQSLDSLQALRADKQAEGDVYMLSRTTERAKLYKNRRFVSEKEEA
jgi:hypothetical protein